MISMYNDNGNDSAENIVFLDNFIALKKRFQEYLFSLILFFYQSQQKQNNNPHCIYENAKHIYYTNF